MIPFQKDTYLVETRVQIFSPSPAICLDVRAKGGGHGTISDGSSEQQGPSLVTITV
jgi:hypothetical protein